MQIYICEYMYKTYVLCMWLSTEKKNVEQLPDVDGGAGESEENAEKKNKE